MFCVPVFENKHFDNNNEQQYSQENTFQRTLLYSCYKSTGKTIENQRCVLNLTMVVFEILF